MSTRHDRNFRSFDGAQEDASFVILDPVLEGWVRGEWSDTCKFSKRMGCAFSYFDIREGGTEDGVDVNNGCYANRFAFFDVVPGQRYALTLKGGSASNVFEDWRLHGGAPVCDIEIGNWSSGNYAPCPNNVFKFWFRDDGKPVTYCYRWGCKPTFRSMQVRHLWWRSIGLTVYWWAKYLWHVVLKRPDK